MTEYLTAVEITEAGEGAKIFAATFDLYMINFTGLREVVGMGLLTPTRIHYYIINVVVND